MVDKEKPPEKKMTFRIPKPLAVRLAVVAAECETDMTRLVIQALETTLPAREQGVPK